jgi:hypothetical protein
MGDDDQERWRGSTDEKLANLALQVGSLGNTVAQLTEHVTQLKIENTMLKTRIGAWSALGGLVGAGIISTAAALLTGSLS